MRRPEALEPETGKKFKRGLWSPEEDEKLTTYMLNNRSGCWSDVAKNSGLQRCGKGCRLRWINYLQPGLKRGPFSPKEEDLIIHLHSILGNRFSIYLHLFLSFWTHVALLCTHGSIYVSFIFVWILSLSLSLIFWCE